MLNQNEISTFHIGYRMNTDMKTMRNTDGEIKSEDESPS